LRLAVAEGDAGRVPPQLQAERLTELGQFLQAEQRHAEAIAPYRKALEMRENELGPQAADLAPFLEDLASALEGAGRSAEGEPHRRRAVALLEGALGPRSKPLGAALERLALALCALGKFEEAEPPYKRATEILKEPSTEAAYAALLRRLGR